MSKNRGRKFASREDWLRVRSTPKHIPSRWLFVSTAVPHLKGTGTTYRRPKV